MNSAVQAAFNDQIKNELFSGYLYLSMSAHLEHENLPGFAGFGDSFFDEHVL